MLIKIMHEKTKTNKNKTANKKVRLKMRQKEDARSHACQQTYRYHITFTKQKAIDTPVPISRNATWALGISLPPFFVHYEAIRIRIPAAWLKKTFC